MKSNLSNINLKDNVKSKVRRQTEKTITSKITKLTALDRIILENEKYSNQDILLNTTNFNFTSEENTQLLFNEISESSESTNHDLLSKEQVFKWFISKLTHVNHSYMQSMHSQVKKVMSVHGTVGDLDIEDFQYTINQFVQFYKVYKDFSEINTDQKIFVGDLKHQNKLLKLIEGETFEEKMSKMNIPYKKLDKTVSQMDFIKYGQGFINNYVNNFLIYKTNKFSNDKFNKKLGAKIDTSAKILKGQVNKSIFQNMDQYGNDINKQGLKNKINTLNEYQKNNIDQESMLNMVRNELKSAADQSNKQSKEREAYLRNEIEILNGEIEDRDKKIIEIDKQTSLITSNNEEEIKKLNDQIELLNRKINNSKIENNQLLDQDQLVIEIQTFSNNLKFRHQTSVEIDDFDNIENFDVKNNEKNYNDKNLIEELKLRIDELEKDNIQLNKKYEEQYHVNMNNNKNINSKDYEIKELQEKINKNELKYKDLIEQKNDELKIARDNFNLINNKNSEKDLELEKLRDQLSTQLQAKIKENFNFKTQNENLNQQIKNRDQEIENIREKLTNQLNSKLIDIQNAEQKVSLLEKENAVVRDEQNKCKNELNQDLAITKNEINKLRDKNFDLESEKSELLQKNSNMNVQLIEITSIVENKNKIIDDLSNEIEKLKQKISQLNKEIESNQVTISNLKYDVESLTLNKRQLEYQIRDNEYLIKKQTLKLDDLNKNNENFQNNLKQNQNNSKELQAIIDELKMEKETLTESLKLAHSNSGKIILDQREISNELNKAENELEKMIEKNNVLEYEKAGLQQNLDKNIKTIKNLEEDFTKIQNDQKIDKSNIIQLEKDIRDLKNEKNNLNMQLLDMTKSCEIKNKSLEDCQDELEKIQNQYQQIKTENDSNIKNIQKLTTEKDKYELEVNHFIENEKKLNQNLSEIKKELLHTKTIVNEEIDSNIKDINKKLEEKNEQVEVLERNLELAENKLKSFQDTQHKFNQMSEENNKLQKQILDLNIFTEEQNLRNSELKQMIEYLESSINYLKSVQTKVIQSVPKFNECLSKKHYNQNNLYTNINLIKDELYIPLNKITSISNQNPSDQFTFRDISNSIENIMYKFENIKDNVSDQLSIVNKDMKQFKLMETELQNTMSSIEECTQNETVLESAFESMRTELSLLKEVEIDQECLLDTLLFVYQNHVDSVGRTMDTNINVVKRLIDSGILVYDKYEGGNQGDEKGYDEEVTVDLLKKDNKWIVKGIKQVIFEHIVLLDKQIIQKNFEDMSK